MLYEIPYIIPIFPFVASHCPQRWQHELPHWIHPNWQLLDTSGGHCSAQESAPLQDHGLSNNIIQPVLSNIFYVYFDQHPPLFSLILEVSRSPPLYKNHLHMRNFHLTKFQPESSYGDPVHEEMFVPNKHGCYRDGSK